MATERLIARVGADVSGFKSGMNSAVGIAKSTALRITAAFAGVMLTSALIGSKFEKTLTETATVAQAFGKDLEALEHKARELGRTTAFTATEAAKGMYDLASAGMNTKQIIDATEHSMKLAGATNSEMSQATSLVSSALKQFGLDASHAKRVVDTYAQAITKSKLTMDRLTEAMKYAGTTGAALGWEIEETTAAVAQFADLGLEGSMAGTNLRMAMMELTKQSGDMSDALSDMGLSFLDVNPEARTFGEILYTLGEKGMTAAQAIAIFGARAGLNMKQLSQAAFIGNSDFAGFVEQLKKAQEGIGRTAEMYNRMMDEFHGDWKIMMSALQDLSIEFFQQFEADGRIIFQRITQYLNEFSGWIRGHGPEIRTFFSGIREQILGIADRFKEWLNTNKELISQGIPNMIKKIGDGLGSIVTLYKSLPDEIIGPTGTGLVVRMLTGSTKIALYAAILHGLYNTIVKINEEGEKASQRIASEGTEVKIKRLEEVKAELEKAYRSKKFGRPEELNKSKYRWTPIDAISAQIDAVEKKINVFKDALSDPGEIFISTDKISGLIIDPLEKNKDQIKTVLEDLFPVKDIVISQFDEIESNFDEFRTNISKMVAETMEIQDIEAGKVLSLTQEDFDFMKQNEEKKLKLREQFASQVYGFGVEQLAIRKQMLDDEIRDFAEAGIQKESLALYAAQRLKEIEIAKNQAILENTNSLFEGLRAGWENYILSTKSLIIEITDLSIQMMQSFAQGIGNAFAQAIIYGKSLSEEFTNMLKNMATTVIAALIKIGVERLVQWTMARVLGITEAVSRMGILAAETYAGAFAATAAIPIVGPILAPGVAAASLAAMLAGATAAKAAGAAVGTGIGSFDEGGISTTPGIYYSGVKEAHIPLKGGKVPVEIGEGVGTTVILENPVFQDLETQRIVFANIAAIIAKDIAPMAVVENYSNDGVIRRMIMSGV